LEQELCEGERVERLFIPAAACLASRRWQQWLWTVWAGILCLVAVPSGGWIWWLLCLLWFARIGQLLLREPADAWVVTNQRCFRIQLSGFGSHVREVSAAPDDAGLPVGALADLRSCIDELSRREGPAVLRRREEHARVARDLPGPLREAVSRRLQGDERLLWVDRPTPRDYFLFAPLDPWCIAGYFAAFPLAALAALSPERLPFAGAALIVGGTATARLWAQIRRTVYAVTDRRGFVLAAGRCREYDHSELRRFHRSQNAAGRGTLAPPLGGVLGDGFYGVRNVKAVDDLIRQRTTRGAATELIPAEPPPGRGDEPLPG
jgi:hypothetical protein